MITRFCQFLVVTLFVIAAGSARAAEDPVAASAPVSVDAIVAEVMAQHPEAQFYEAELAVARGELSSAGTLDHPELSVAAGARRVTEAVVREGAAWSVSVRQTFEWPGRVSLRKAIANRQIALAELGLAQFKASLAARTRGLVLKYFAAQEQAAAAREVADRIHALREVLVQREPSGLTPALELRVIEASELTLHRRASEGAIAEREALLELNQLRGVPAAQALRVAPPGLEFSPSASLDDLIKAALTGNFEVQVRRAELEQQGLRVSLARNARNSSFSVGPYVSQERAVGRESQVGTEATVPLPTWNGWSGDVAIAEARQRQAETVLLVTQRELELSIARQAIRYDVNVAEMAKWRPDAVAQFKSAAALADQHYRLGAVPVVIYVELQKQYLDAVAALLETRLEALEAAQELQRLTGVNLLPPGATGTK